MRIQSQCLIKSLIRQATSKYSPLLSTNACRVTQGYPTQTSSFWVQCCAASTSTQPTHLEALKQRGLISEAELSHFKTSPVENVTISEDGKHVTIAWNSDNNHVSRFHAVWLRHSCHCPECRLDHNGMICSGPEDIDLGIRVISAEVQDDFVVVFKWLYSDGVTTHEGPIPVSWLRNNCSSDLMEAERSKARAMIFHKDKTVPTVEYEAIMNTDKGLYEWLCHLEERGICLLKNCPQKEGVVGQVAERIAPVQHTVYGEVFDVVSQAQPINAAYSAVSLELHMDQCMYEIPPGLQLLHCIEFDPNIIGGDSTFGDIFELALQLREERPDYFETLARVPVVMSTIHYNRDYPVHMTCERPLFGLNEKQELIKVLWHPMMAHVHPKEEYTESFFAAYKHFYNMVKFCKSLYSLRLVGGDLISFNNRRVLHGRTSYSNQTGLRFLQGTYVELSEFRSRLQVFHNKLGDGRLARRVGMEDWS